jgi:hypothetical protein
MKSNTANTQEAHDKHKVHTSNRDREKSNRTTSTQRLNDCKRQEHSKREAGGQQEDSKRTAEDVK